MRDILLGALRLSELINPEKSMLATIEADQAVSGPGLAHLHAGSITMSW